MSNGQQQARENVQRLTAWIAERNVQKDYGEYERQGKINRQALCVELDFGRSVVNQNPTVRALIEEAESVWYGAKEQDKKAHEAARERSETRVAKTNMEVSRLMDELARVKAENSDLKARLRKYAAIEQVMQQTGMLPR